MKHDKWKKAPFNYFQKSWNFSKQIRIKSSEKKQNSFNEIKKYQQ